MMSNTEPKKLEVPDYFLLNDHYINRAISYLRSLVLEKSIKIALDFSKLKDIRRRDWTVLIAQLEKSRVTFKKEIYWTGRLPKSKKILKVLTSGNSIIHESKQINPASFTDAERAKLVNPKLIDNVVKELKKIGIKEYYSPFNTFLTEIIGNAVEHGIETKNINWWLASEIDYHAKRIDYTFVDMGHGIIESHKSAGLPWKYWFFSDKRIVIDALLGNLGSSTKVANRGKGLPQLRKLVEDGIVSDLVLITNKVRIRYVDRFFRSSKNPNFVGTLYSWTIDRTNFEKWKTFQ